MRISIIVFGILDGSYQIHLLLAARTGGREVDQGLSPCKVYLDPGCPTSFSLFFFKKNIYWTTQKRKNVQGPVGFRAITHARNHAQTAESLTEGAWKRLGPTWTYP